MREQNNCFLDAIRYVCSPERESLGAFPPTTFKQNDKQSWEEFLSELEIALPEFERLCEGKSTLTIQKDKKEGTIFIRAETNLL
ncbi:hypothetical protein F0225_19285 [Vibrio pectenicida]|uniref:Uncharacterized protein n=1 Tax=Vibrio pectenicida TaxID=62763 RepID=A0A7Y4A2Q5_9VIBR|nr:hypothetical protein [Vibrio pectenicida]NOH73453.1 hypothetical protein [Vibrio pectenicida]